MTAATRATLFDPREWVYCPVMAAGVHRSDLERPCGCGCEAFILVLRADGQSGGVCCLACYEAPRSRLARRGDLIYGRVAGGAIEYAGDPAEWVRRRDRMRAAAGAPDQSVK